MKLRVRGNSIRLRLTRAEVARIAGGESVEEVTVFSADARFGYRFECDATIASAAARYTDGTMCIVWPAQDAVAWARSEQVGLAASCSIPDGMLQLVVEKDFACLAPREGGEDVDTFPHPRAS
ncbi:MAG: hypothetical protein ABI321_13210 [Polyangia bacterium]